MRPMAVVPTHEETKLTAHSFAPERNQDASRALAEGVYWSTDS